MLDVFKCGKCGKIVMVVSNGDGQLVCHGLPMIRQEENTVDASTEKHVPVVETQGAGILVRVGSVPHPMEEAHHLQWIEVISGPWLYVKGLKPGDKPEAAFPGLSTDVKARGVLQSPRVVVQQAAPVNRIPGSFFTSFGPCR